MPRNNPEAQARYFKKWYANNRQRCIDAAAARDNQIRRTVSAYKAKRGCAHCPEKDPVCLEFHHVDPDLKDINIADIANKGWGDKRLMSEIEKCEVLCSNCHKKEHAKLRAHVCNASTDGSDPSGLG